MYKTKSLKKAYQLLVVFTCKNHGQESTKAIPVGWAALLDQLVNDGRPFNWSDMLAHHLKSHVSKAQNLPKNKQARFYMSAYLLDAIRAQQQFPDMS